jgi:hypothetical protein
MEKRGPLSPEIKTGRTISEFDNGPIRHLMVLLIHL